MNKRIRYVKWIPGKFRSGQYIKSADGAEYCVVLSDDNTGYVEKIGVDFKIPIKGTSMHKLKIKAKETLVKLGCAFEAETRKKATDEVGS